MGSRQRLRLTNPALRCPRPCVYIQESADVWLWLKTCRQALLRHADSARPIARTSAAAVAVMLRSRRRGCTDVSESLTIRYCDCRSLILDYIAFVVTGRRGEIFHPMPRGLALERELVPVDGEHGQLASKSRTVRPGVRERLLTLPCQPQSTGLRHLAYAAVYVAARVPRLCATRGGSR